jgi:hypothetical protein
MMLKSPSYLRLGPELRAAIVPIRMVEWFLFLLRLPGGVLIFLSSNAW